MAQKKKKKTKLQQIKDAAKEQRASNKVHEQIEREEEAKYNRFYDAREKASKELKAKQKKRIEQGKDANAGIAGAVMGGYSAKEIKRLKEAVGAQQLKERRNSLKKRKQGF